MARPKRIVLIRHAKSAANADLNIRCYTPDHLIPLTDEGHEQSLQAGAKLLSLFGTETIGAYLSPYLRTRATFEGIKQGADQRLKVARAYEDPRIREQDFGHFRALEAFPLIDSERASYGTFFYRIPDGESGADVYDRISSFLETLWRDFAKEHYPDNALIISHGLTIRLFLMRWFHWSVEKFEKLKNPSNCEYFVMDLGANGRYTLDRSPREYSPQEVEQYKTQFCRKPWTA
jgi:broad specificity phosphatase PhoE